MKFPAHFFLPREGWGGIYNILFGSMTTLVVVITISFGIYEYRREHAFRIDILHAQLQLNNLKTLSNSPYFGTQTEQIARQEKALRLGEGADTITYRVTIIDQTGNVIYDSREKDVRKMGNHLHRKEIQDALRYGSGYDIKRESETNGETYFYSATLIQRNCNQLATCKETDGGSFVVVRSAVPYSAPLTASLERDYTFFYYTAGILVLVAIVLYLRSRLTHSENEKQRIKRQLTENAAHELKTPAATIGGYLETLVENPDMPQEKRNEFIERCYTQSKRMSRLLADMSTLTQLDSPSPALPKREETIDVAAILHQIANDTKLQFESKNICLTLDIPERMLMQADASLIYSMLQNFFSNTLAYAAGATYFRIKAVEMTTPLHKGWTLHFIDNGVGVSPEHLPHLFERFYRTDKGRSRRLGGTGLGLAIVKNIAVRYGGHATATSTFGGGLTIEIEVNAR